MRRQLPVLAVAVAAALGTVAVSSAAAPSLAPSTAVRFPAGYAGQIYVGETKVWPTTDPTTTTTVLASTSTSTTSAPTTTAATTTTEAPTTTSTTPPTSSPGSTTTTLPSGSAGCGLTSAAFCDTFDSSRTGQPNAGELGPVWGVSRVADLGSGHTNAVGVSHNACDGGGSWNNVNPDVGYSGGNGWHYFGPFTPVPDDVQICNGLMVESVNDGGGVQSLHTYPKQPFNFDGRTGTVVFDVSNDTTGTHGAWPEFVITDEPVPGTRREPTSAENVGGTTTAKNQVGFSMAGGSSTQWGVDDITFTNNGAVSYPNVTQYGLVNKGCLAGHSYNCATTQMNHVEVKVSSTRIDIYATDPGSSNLVHLAGANISLNASFKQGLIWPTDVHYNAHKAVEPCACGIQYDHSFAWDNVGFDGPKTYRDVGFDVPFPGGPHEPASFDPVDEIPTGYDVNGSKTLTVLGVSFPQSPTSIKVVLNTWYYNNDTPLTVKLNGCAGVTRSDTDHGINAFSFVFASSCAVPGDNTLVLTSSAPLIVFNVSLIGVAGAPVP
jgi:hypothetical protein